MNSSKKTSLRQNVYIPNNSSDNNTDVEEYKYKSKSRKSNILSNRNSVRSNITNINNSNINTNTNSRSSKKYNNLQLNTNSYLTEKKLFEQILLHIRNRNPFGVARNNIKNMNTTYNLDEITKLINDSEQNYNKIINEIKTNNRFKIKSGSGQYTYLTTPEEWALAIIEVFDSISKFEFNLDFTKTYIFEIENQKNICKNKTIEDCKKPCTIKKDKYSINKKHCSFKIEDNSNSNSNSNSNFNSNINK